MALALACLQIETLLLPYRWAAQQMQAADDREQYMGRGFAAAVIMHAATLYCIIAECINTSMSHKQHVRVAQLNLECPCTPMHT